MKNGCHIYATVSDMDMGTMCEYSPSQHALSHWKCVLRCCANFPRLDLSGQSSDRRHFNTYSLMCFHIYRLIARFAVHEICPLDEK